MKWKTGKWSLLLIRVCFVQFQAIQSLNKYPLPLKSAKEAKILQNFGDGICKILDEKLQRYYRDHGKPMTIHRLGCCKSPLSTLFYFCFSRSRCSYSQFT